MRVGALRRAGHTLLTSCCSFFPNPNSMSDSEGAHERTMAFILECRKAMDAAFAVGKKARKAEQDALRAWNEALTAEEAALTAIIFAGEHASSEVQKAHAAAERGQRSAKRYCTKARSCAELSHRIMLADVRVITDAIDNAMSSQQHE